MSDHRMPRFLRVVAALGVLAAGWPAFAQRITDLPAATSVNSADLLAIVQMPGAVARRTTVGAIAGATTYPPAANGTIISNISGATATPTGNTLTQVLNALGCTAQGSILYKSASAWTCLAPGTSGHSLTTLGAGANPAWQASSGGSVTSITAGTGITTGGSPITTTGTVSLATIANNTILGNVSGSTTNPTAISVTSLFNSSLCSAQGSIIYRDASAWVCLAPGTNGQYLQTQGAAANPQWATVSGGAAALTINAQTGTSYTVVNGDLGKLVTLSNAGAVAVTLPQAGGGGNFTSGWYAYFRNLNVGEVTITPTISTISSAIRMRLAPNNSVLIISDGTNYYSQVFSQGGTGIDSASIASRGNITITGPNAGAFASGNTIASTISGAGSAIIATSGNSGTTITGVASVAIATTGGNTIGGEASATVGGGTNTITGDAAVTLGGTAMSASGKYSVSMGKNGGAVNDGTFNINGGNWTNGARSPQSHTQVQGMGDLQTATTKEFFFDAGTIAARFSLPDNSGANVQVSCVIQDRATMNKINGFVLMTGSNPGAIFYRGSGAATIAMLGSPTMNSVASNSSGTNLTMAIAADTTNGNIKLTVTDSTGGNQFYGACTLHATMQRH